jgi:hypothetical protein
MSYSFIVLNDFINYSVAFQSFGFERIRWKLFQKHVVRTKLDIYVFITHLARFNVRCSYMSYWRKKVNEHQGQNFDIISVLIVQSKSL